MTEGTGRIDAFSDGVFAIAITLLVLEIRLQHAGVDGSLWTALVALWPSYFAFALSFFVILVTWIAYHDLIRLVRATNRPVQIANGCALLYVTFILFPTAVLAAPWADSRNVGSVRGPALAPPGQVAELGAGVGDQNIGIEAADG